MKQNNTTQETAFNCGSLIFVLVWNNYLIIQISTNLSRDMTNQQSGCAPSEYLDKPGHPPSLARVFAVRMKKA